MNCNEAQAQIDERIQAEADRRVAGRDQWTELDDHLARCGKCLTVWNELRQTRALLNRAATDAPTSEEVKTMWNVIAETSMETGVVKKNKPIGLTAGWQFAAALAGVAVILGSALGIGLTRYREKMALSATSMHLRNISTSSRVYSGLYEWGRHEVEHKERKKRTRARRKIRKRPASGENVATARSGGEVGGRSAGDSVSLSRSDKPARVNEPADSSIAGGLELYYDQATGWAVPPDDGFNGESHDAWSGGHDEALMPAQAPPARQTESPPSTTAPSKIIKTGTLTIEVEVYADAFQQLEETVRKYDAFVADVATREQAGGAIRGIVKIRIEPESFEALFAALKTLGRIESEDIRTTDVTDEYVDLESRISGLEAMEHRLSDLIANKSFVDKISSLLEVERELKRVRVEREQLLGSLRVMQDRIGLSTITLTLHEPPRTVPEATLSIETTILDEAAGALGKLLARLDGRLLSGTTAKQSNGTLSGVYRLQIRLTHFRELLDGIEGLGRISRRAVNDQQFGDLHAPWAENVPCVINLNIAERSQELPSGSIQLEVDTLGKALQQVDAALSPLNGSIVSNQTTRMDDGSQHAELDLLVPAGVFSELVASLTAIGRTMEKSLSGNIGRIVGGAAATPCRLSLTLTEQTREVPRGHIIVEVAEFEAARTQLAQLVTDKNIHVSNSTSNQRTDGSWAGSFNLGIPAKDMETVVARLESLGRVASRHIQGLGLGDLSRVLPDTIGVIDLRLAEPKAIAPGPDQAGQSIRNRLRDGFVVMYTSVGLIAYGLVVMVPWVLILLLPAWLLFRLVRWRKAAAVKGETA